MILKERRGNSAEKIMAIYSQQAAVLWAKKTKNDEWEAWLPLVTHMRDAAETAALLWRDWLPDGTKRRLAQGILPKGNGIIYEAQMEQARNLFIFLAALHDWGKGCPVFQSKLANTVLDAQLRRSIEEAGLLFPNRTYPKVVFHAWVSQFLLEKAGYNPGMASILGSHHGKPPSSAQMNMLSGYESDIGIDQENWRIVQRELLNLALELAQITEKEAKTWIPDVPSQVLLSGLIIMVDWIVSNEKFFPLVGLEEGAYSARQRADSGWERLDLPEYWSPLPNWDRNDFYQTRFQFSPRPIQAALLEQVKKIEAPGMIVVEAPMGEGKTEAALAAAEALAERTGRSGVFFALPTQATANGLFPRVRRWIKQLDDGIAHAIYLAHGKADLNEEYCSIQFDNKSDQRYSIQLGGEEIEAEEDAVFIHDWLHGRKKGILADFIVGTIDQVLMSALKQKHLTLRHIGLVNKVVILDECHAYDAYMNQYLYKALNWLGAYGVPVIVLSATLPGVKREALLNAYLDKYEQPYDPLFPEEKMEIPQWVTTREYPLITYTNKSEVQQETVAGERRSLEVSLDYISDKEFIPKLDDLLENGGCAGIIVNTVSRAQTIAKMLRTFFGEATVCLLHSQFLALDRAEKEQLLFTQLGAGGNRPDCQIVVGTQIFEQSCDLDFDVLITDICPMDLLLQRIGRLHRHQQDRPDKLQHAKCFVSGADRFAFDKGAEAIYGKYFLMNTYALLSSKLTLPGDIPRLVQEAYDLESLSSIPEQYQVEYERARCDYEKALERQKSKAQSFQISNPSSGLPDLVGWLDTDIRDDPSGKRGEATVRDTSGSIEVLVVQQKKDGNCYLLPWIPKWNGEIIPRDRTPETDMAMTIAKCSIRLPQVLCLPWMIDKTITELEKMSVEKRLEEWQSSPWLKGQLFLILDEDFVAELNGYRLKYVQEDGLQTEKIEGGA